NLGKAFGKAINLSFFGDISITVLLLREFLSGMGVIDKSATSLYQWRSAMEIFRRASEVYKKKNHKPPVIIYDNVNRLVKDNAKILDILQDDAKDNADDSAYIAVFVSEGNVPKRLQSRSSWSRAEPIEIGDISREESLNYLINKRGIKTVKEGKIDTTDAEKLFDLVGGRIIDLKSVADLYQEGQSIEVIKHEILVKVNNKFRTAKLLKNDEHHEVGKRIIGALRDSGELSRTEFEEFFKTRQEADEVLGTN
ncbi:14456_t:CDS:2, partial [Acaulospora morrowiae]